MSFQKFRTTRVTAATGSYSQGVFAGNTLYLAGQTGEGLDGSPPTPGDAAAQTRRACENIRQLLNEAGGDLSHVVKLTNYITDRAYRKPVYEVIAEYFGPYAPASTGVIVDGLASEDFLVEIDATAHIPLNAGVTKKKRKAEAFRWARGASARSFERTLGIAAAPSI